MLFIYYKYFSVTDQNNIKINMSTLWSHPLAIQRKMNDVPTIIRTSKHTIMLDNLELWVFQEEKLEYKTTLKSLSDYKVQFVKVGNSSIPIIETCSNYFFHSRILKTLGIIVHLFCSSSKNLNCSL